MDALTAALATIKSAPDDRRTTALETALKLIANILAKQEDPKYRRVRASNPKLDAALFSVDGGRELLLAVGFEPTADGELVLPGSVSLVRLVQARREIEVALQQPRQAPAQSRPTAPVPVAAPVPDAAPSPAAPQLEETAMDVDEDADEDLAAALALSRGEMPDALAPDEDVGEDDEMRAALALSMEGAGPAQPVTPVPSQDDAPQDKQAVFQARVKQLFDEIVASGLSPNEAAAKALERASAEAKAAPAGPVSSAALAPDGASLLERSGFEARVKALFETERARGKDPNDAAAAALKQAQAEQLAAAQQARRERAAAGAKESSGGGDSGGGGPEGASEPPSVMPQLSGEVEKFERWEEIEKVAQAQVDVIMEMFRSEGVKFIDPSFPPSDRSLYQSTESATTWKCRACGARSALPPPPDAQELARMMHDPSAAAKMIRCPACQLESHMLEVALRPTGWARPSELRDDVTLQFSSVPWVVIRDEPRADDIRQGHVGNCWFVCAMSALAEYPETIRRILLTADHNHAGVYQVKLCRAGEWHCVLIDDVLPVNALSCLAYLKAARRSLWVPLIEKAAAKISGSYEALNGGTFSEAFGMLTGMPVQTIRLSKYKPPEEPPSSASPEERKSYERRLEKWKAKGYDYDELYAQLYSFRASGFVIGCSTFFVKEAEINEARATGIQVPHAYCLLDLRPCDGEDLVKLRNPNGHAGWRGEWSRSSSKWTYERRQEMGLDQEDSGVFWMSWTDFTRLFAQVEVCRLLPNHLEARQGGWLPSVFGSGQAVEIEVYAHTQLELTLHQEAHSNRGETAIATLKDMGVAVFKVGSDGADLMAWDGAGSSVANAANEKLTLVAWGERAVASSLSIDTTLHSDGFTSRYLVVPLCFGNLSSPEPRKFAVAALSNQPLAVDTVPLRPAQLAAGYIDIAVKHGEKQKLLTHPTMGEMLNIYMLEEEGGYAVVAENVSMLRIRAEIDFSDHTTGFTSSRGALFSEDVLPPRSRQLLMVLSIDMSKKTHGMSLRFGGGPLDPADVVPPGAGHIPSLSDLGALAPLHEPVQMATAGAMSGFGGLGGAAPPPTAGGVDPDISSLAASIMSQMRQQPR